MTSSSEETKTPAESTSASTSTKKSAVEGKEGVSTEGKETVAAPKDPPALETVGKSSTSPKASPAKGHYAHPMPHHLPPHLHHHHHYYPYHSMPLPYDAAYAIAAAAAANSDFAKRKNSASGSPSASNSQSTGGEGDGSPASPPKSGGTATPSAGSPLSGARDQPYPPPPSYYHPHAPPHPLAAAAYHRWAEAAAAAGYPPPHHRYPPHYDPYAVAMAYANNNNNNTSPGTASEQSPHGHPYRFSDPTLRREALSHANSSSDKNASSPSKGGDPTTADMEHPNMAYLIEMEARADGATSPSQIEDFHREEVTSMGCTCKKTKCLKLYCQCFGVKIYCGANCRCLTCHNLPQYDLERETAIRIILTRNPNAFETKFQKNTNLPLDNPVAMAAMIQQDEATRQPGALPIPARILSHKLGCKCRKSACMKKYCECYAGNVKCSGNCRCVGCKNMPPGGIKDDDNPLAGAVSKKDPAKREAAYNLTFLKHGSAEKPKRTNSSDKSEAGSMPSLASEESPTGGRGLQRHAEGPKPVPPNTPLIDTLPSSEQTAVNALLMAARAMTEMTGPYNQKSPDESEARTPPVTNASESEGTPDESMRTAQRNLLVKFTSPKRKAGNAVVKSEDTFIQNNTDRPGANGVAGNKNDDTFGEDVQFAKRSRLGLLKKDPEVDSRNDNKTKDDAMEMSTPAKGTSGTLTDLTPVSARCIDFKNMRVNDPKDSPAPL